jgi:zinc protease
VAETELVPRKAVLIGGFGRALETTEGLVQQVASLALYGLGLEEINSYIRNVQSVTPADIQKFAGSRIGAAGANIIIVGNSKDFIEPLRKQFRTVEVIPFAELDLNSATLRKSAGEGAKK